MRHARGLLQRPHHGVERVGDADDEGVGGIFLDAGADLLHHLEIDAQEIVTAHARLARDAGGHDADRGALERLIGVHAGKADVVTVDRRRLGDVEGLALRNALGDVEQHHVAEFLETHKVRERAADLACADQCNFWTCHVR